MSDNFSRDSGGVDLEDGHVYDASFECHDCGLYYSWPATPGLAANEDPKQTDMLVLVNAHTLAACRATKAAAAIEHANELTGELAGKFAAHEGAVREKQYCGSARVRSLIDLATIDGHATPISGDPVVTLRQAIDRGAVTVTKGLPAAVAMRRAHLSLDGSYRPIRWVPGREGESGMTENSFMWPAPSHQALTESITSLAASQRRLLIGGRLQCGGDNSDINASAQR